MFKQISFSSKDKSCKQNIFTFDQDGDQDVQEYYQTQKSKQLYQKQKRRIFNDKPHILNTKQYNSKSQQSQQPNDLFVFDQDQQEQQMQKQNIPQRQHKRQVLLYSGKRNSIQSKQIQEVSQEFNYLKNKILFKQHNNYVHKNLQLRNDVPKYKAPEPLRPQGVTSSFQNKIKRVRKSIKENINQPLFRKTLSQNTPFTKKQNIINLNQTASNFKKSKFNNQQHEFQAFKQNRQFNYSNEDKQKYQIQGAKIVSNSQTPSQQFQYVEQQKAIKVTNLKQFLYTQLSQEYKVNAIIKKVDDGSFFGKLVNKTKYFVTIEENNKFLFSVIKDGFNRLIFSMNKDDCTQRKKNYLGQMIGKDFSNTQYILYDGGFDPKQTKCLEFSYKQLASIKYQQSSGPRKFGVILSTNNKGFHSMQTDVNILERKWSEKKQRKNLCKLYSKQPKYDQTDGNYKLDFKGMVGKASVKNFVLSSDQYEDCLIFARRTDDTYALQVKHPFSLMQAVAVCMSSIYHKTMF